DEVVAEGDSGRRICSQACGSSW
ncbi:hypothetical protein TNIN_149051, partial [Trichonephila inaurata madagascariensis]